MSSGISMAGMGTGLDVYGMAEQMANIQIQPKANQLEQQEADVNAELTALNELMTALDTFYNVLEDFSDPTAFGSVHVQMNEADMEYVTASVDSDAVTNTYELTVEQLATQHKVQFVSGPAGVAEVPPGQYTFGVGGEEMTIDVVAGENSLDEVATQINEAPDNPGITASVVSDGTESYLTLTADETGEDNTISIKQGKVPRPPEKELSEAQDAIYTLDGIEMTSPDNTIDDVVDGVTFELEKVTGWNESITIDVESDTSTMSSSVTSIVDAFNAVLTTLDNLMSATIDESTGEVTSRPPLASDPMVSGIERELREILQTTFPEPYTSFAEIGITSQRDGTLEVDSATLNDALNEDPDAVTDMFMTLIEGLQDVIVKYVGEPEPDEEDSSSSSSDDTGSDDPATSAYESTGQTNSVTNTNSPEEKNSGLTTTNTPDDSTSTDEEYIPSTGLIDDRIESLESELDDIEEEWVALEARFESIYQRYLDEYIAMDLAVAEMQNSMMMF